MVNLFEYILAQDDPFSFIYDGISGAYGAETQAVLNDLYSDISVDFFMHPDDDFEKIIERMIEYMEVA
jgi:hypothetical protein